MVLKTENLSIGYKKKIILADINLEIEMGSIVAIVGPNGCGKSTLLKTLSGQLAPIEGSIFLEGKNLNSISRGDLARKISILMTERVSGEYITCEDVVAAGRYPYTGTLGILGDNDKRVIKWAMDLFKIGELALDDTSRISDGQRQRVMAARALAQEPDILIMDEPTSFLDIKYKLELFDILKKLKEEKRLTVIMSLHELELAGLIADKVICLKKGSVPMVLEPDSVFNTFMIDELYDIPPGTWKGILKGERLY